MWFNFILGSILILFSFVCGERQGGRKPEVMGLGNLREAEEEGTGAGRNGKTFATSAQYFAREKAHRGGNCYGKGRRPGVQGAFASVCGNYDTVMSIKQKRKNLNQA